MCTAITLSVGDGYFGRNLDLEHSYGERVTITPRAYPLRFCHVPELGRHYAMIGMAAVADGYPLYYDATNERGLSMAGLNFPGNAVYFQPCEGKDNLAPFELIPWVLGQCESVAQARELLSRLNPVQRNFSADLTVTPLHWFLADGNESMTLESVAQGVRIYDNPVGVLTNNPPFPYHMDRLSDFLSVSSDSPENRFAPELDLTGYSRGMGGMGLPGDLSSSSRFVRAAFHKWNSVCNGDEQSCVNQFFHILSSVAQVRGCNRLANGQYEITRYSSCCNLRQGLYYYTTYENPQPACVNLHAVDLNGDGLSTYPIDGAGSFRYQN